jgi:hypothetical protein
MAKGQADSVTTNESNESTATAQELVDTVLGQLKTLGAGEESSRLFPGGIGSVDLIALRIVGAQSVAASASLTSTEDDEASITFNTEGHHVIALIAQQDLQTRLPNVAQKVERILSAGNRDIKEAATFPDDIRNQQPETKPFHFIDIPFEEGGPVNPPLPGAPHVLSKIEEFSQFFRQGGGNAQENVDALSWLIHMFGDVHQPLHCIERISELHPGGDRGGNSFRLKGKAKNLHSAWDSSVNVLHLGKDEDELPIEIMQEHSRARLSDELTVTDPEDWARASFNLAKKHAYSIEENPENPPRLSTTYLNNMERVGRRQAALAGYRLADRLEAILP